MANPPPGGRLLSRLMRSNSTSSSTASSSLSALRSKLSPSKTVTSPPAPTPSTSTSNPKEIQLVTAGGTGVSNGVEEISSSSSPTPKEVVETSRRVSLVKKPPEESVDEKLTKQLPVSDRKNSIPVDGRKNLTVKTDIDESVDVEREKLTAEIRESIYEELSGENKLLENELSSLHEQNGLLTRQNRELKATVDEILAQSENQMEDSKATNHDLLARLEILEAELGTCLARAEKTEIEYKSLVNEHADLQIRHKKTVDDLTTTDSRLRQAESDLARSREQLEQLTQHAQTKLRQSAEEYMRVMRHDSEKSELLTQMGSELEKIRHRAQMAESRLDQVSGENKRLTLALDQLDASNREKSLEVVQITANLTKSNTELANLQNKTDELFALNNRYKEEIVQCREALRGLQGSRDLQDLAQKKVSQAEAMLKEVEMENRVLKSKLFDKMETEKQLRESVKILESGSKDPAAVVTASELKKAREEIKALQNEVKAKDQEKNELMGICEDLMAQVESLKSQHEQEPGEPDSPQHPQHPQPAPDPRSQPQSQTRGGSRGKERG